MSLSDQIDVNRKLQTSNVRSRYSDPKLTEERRLRAEEECQVRYGHGGAQIQRRPGDAHFYAREQMDLNGVPYRHEHHEWKVRIGDEPPKVVVEAAITARCLCCYKQDPDTKQLKSPPLHITCPGLFPPST